MWKGCAPLNLSASSDDDVLTFLNWHSTNLIQPDSFTTNLNMGFVSQFEKDVWLLEDFEVECNQPQF